MGPLKMDRNVAENWRKWRHCWNLYAKASGANEKDQATQCAVFLHTIGEEALAVYDTFSFTETKKDKIEPLVQKFEDYCLPKRNTTYERYVFNTCKQNGRTLDEFLLDLRNKAKTCEFGELRDSLIRDRIVCGIDNNSVRERLLRDNNLSLEKAISAVRAAETSKNQVKNLNNSPFEVGVLHKYKNNIVPKTKSKNNSGVRAESQAKPSRASVVFQITHRDNALRLDKPAINVKEAIILPKCGLLKFLTSQSQSNVYTKSNKTKAVTTLAWKNCFLEKF